MNFLVGRNKKKIRKDVLLIPILFAKLRSSLSKKNYQVIKVLLDGGASPSVIHTDLVKLLRVTKDRETVWNTAGGKLITGSMCNIEFSLPEFSPTATVSYKVHVITQKTMFLKCDMIMGRELMTHDRTRIKHMFFRNVREVTYLPLGNSHEGLRLHTRNFYIYS